MLISGYESVKIGFGFTLGVLLCLASIFAVRSILIQIVKVIDENL